MVNKTTIKGLPCAPAVENLASAGDTGLIPGLEIFHVSWSKSARVPQLPKPTCLTPVLCNRRGCCSEKPMTLTRDWPHSLQPEHPRPATKAKHSHTNLVFKDPQNLIQVCQKPSNFTCFAQKIQF